MKKIDLKNRNSLAVLTDKSVKELLDKGYNFTEIGKELGVSGSAVCYYCKARGWKSNFKYTKEFDTEEFIKLYNLGYNDLEISRIMNTNHCKLQTYRKHELKLPINKKNNFKYTKKEIAALIGLVLGDGHFKCIDNSYSGNFAHSLKQEDYFKWKYSIFSKEKISDIKYQDQFDKRTNKTYHKIYSYFRASDALKELYDAFYKNKIKQVYNKQYIIDNFTDLSLVIWYGDDGYVRDNAYHFSTNCFDDNTLEFLQKLLKNRYEIETTIFKNKIMRVLKRDSAKIKPIFKKYLPKSMWYKL